FGGVHDVYVTVLPPLDDTDRDFLSDTEELALGTNPYNRDSDSDEMPDGWEFAFGLNASQDDSTDDLDSDGVPNYYEYTNNTRPDSSDTDKDALSDLYEIVNGLDPTDRDFDDDSLYDGFEVFSLGSNPASNDTDSDLMPDGWEYTYGLNLTLDDSADDFDVDLLLNLEEYQVGTDPTDWDTDGDIISDYDEVYVYLSDPLDPLSPQPNRDPEFASYFGGSGTDHFIGVSVADGYLYVAGRSTASNFPVSDGYDLTHNGNYDVVVLKLDLDATTVVYSTYIGGSSNDYGYTLTHLSDGSVVISGVTYSTNFPTVNAHDTTLSGTYDAILVRLNSTGTGLIFSTLVGGNGYDAGRGICTDESNNIYVVGWSSSSDLVTLNAYQSSYGGGNYDFLLMLARPDGIFTSISYLGGPSEDVGEAINLDSQGNILITGRNTGSFPMVNSYDSTFNGEYDAVIAKLDPTASSIIWSTYYGGTYEDRGRGLVVDSHDNVIIVGYSESSNLPMFNSYDSSKSSYFDAFVCEFSADGSSIIYSTYLGTSGYDYGYWIGIDAFDNVYATGRVEGSGFPVLNEYDATWNSNEDLFVTKFNDTGGLKYSTYYGGSADELPYAIDVSDDGKAYIVGRTYSSNFPTYNPIDSTISTTPDAFIVILPNLDDFDSDGLSDSDEASYGCSWVKNDTDGDTIPDGWEVLNGLDPTVNDTGIDSDSDGLFNVEEYIYGCDVFNNDTDSDRLEDGPEVNIHGTDPANNDTDADLLSDGDEILTYFTLPNNNDTDSDTMIDGWEVMYGLNASDAADAYLDLDTEGLLNVYEFGNGTLPNDNDTDDDNLSDYDEIVIYGTSPILEDTDGDLFNDGYEVLVILSDPLDPNDPSVNREPSYSSYLGHSDSECGYVVKVDSSGNIYVGGYTYSSLFPTSGGYDDSYNGYMDTFLTKYSPDGQSIIFSTFIGGSNRDSMMDLTFDAEGNIIATGYTRSSDFPTVNAFQEDIGGYYDAFITRISSSGSQLLFSSYLGGNSRDEGAQLMVDGEGILWLCGFTESADFPTTSGAFDETHGGSLDGFIVKIDIDNSHLIASTYLGGNDYDITYAMCLASDNTVILAGTTGSTNFPTYAAIDDSHNGEEDCFITKMNRNLDAIIYSTFIGGSSYDYFTRMYEDTYGELILSGFSQSDDYPMVGGYDTTHNGNYDVIVVRADASDGSIIKSTYVGGDSTDRCYGLGVDDFGNVYLAAETYSSNFPLELAFHDTHSSDYDTVLFKLTKDLDQLAFSTLLEGSSGDNPRDMTIDENCNMYVTGYTSSSDFTMYNAYDDTFGGGNDVFLTVLPPLDDSDSDGIRDQDESSYGTHPFDKDSDDDLMPDGWEVL
ncbi:MAG: SBBP repeat-containing protein, partial [Candidatus Thorarchaeota archaeon]